MSDMRADLIVIRGRKVAFSKYQVKPNGTYMVLPLTKMLSLGDRRFIIPLSSTSNFLLNEYAGNELKDVVAKDYVGVGVLAHSICNHCINEYNAAGLEHGSLTIVREMEIDEDKFVETKFCRSKSYNLESAANAGLHIYDDVAVIYREAFKACGYSNPPFYVGNIDEITDTIDYIYMKCEQPLIELIEKRKEIKEKIKQEEDEHSELKNVENEINKIRDMFSFFMAKFTKTFRLEEYDKV